VHSNIVQLSWEEAHMRVVQSGLKNRLTFNAAAVALGISLAFLSPSAMACNDGGNCANAPGHNKDSFAAAPGPIAGAGLPVLAVVGAGYWAYRRYRRRRS
jgi:hypothetical protein